MRRSAAAAFRDAASAMLERGGIVVVGTACDAAEALRRAGELHPDIALVDVDLAPTAVSTWPSS